MPVMMGRSVVARDGWAKELGAMMYQIKTQDDR